MAKNKNEEINEPRTPKRGKLRSDSDIVEVKVKLSRGLLGDLHGTAHERGVTLNSLIVSWLWEKRDSVHLVTALQMREQNFSIMESNEEDEEVQLPALHASEKS